MRAAVLYGRKDLKVVEIPDRTRTAEEVKIRVEKVGICGTDVLVYEGVYESNIPIVLGHEFAGVVDEVGEEVKDLKPGDRVTAGGSWACGKCRACRTGKPIFCTDRQSMGRKLNGAMAEFVYVPRQVVYKLPGNVDMDNAQSFIPIACASHAVRKAKITAGQSAIVFGSGHSALIILQVLKTYGADKVVVVGGSRASRLRAAVELGADEVIGRSDLDIASLAAMEPDVVVEASGATSAFKNAVEVVKPGGTVVVYSIYKSPIEKFDATKLYSKEISIVGSKGGRGDYDSAVNILANESISVAPLISHTFNLSDIAEAFSAISNKDKNMFRVVINPKK